MLSNIRFSKCQMNLKNANNITIENCIFEDKEVKVYSSNKITFENCLFHGIYIIKCLEVTIKHCTMLSPKGGIEAAVRLETNQINISDSIIYGDKYGILFMQANTKRKCYIDHCLWYGETALCVKQIGNKPIQKNDIAQKKSRLRRFCRPNKNIYQPPSFINAPKGDWRLVKGVPGSGEASDGKNCGVIWGGH